MMNKVLVTGIEPFDGDAVNPSWQVAQALAGEHIAGAEIAVLELPCVLGVANQQLIAAIEALQPLAVICLGLAGGRAEISLERVAINLIDARIPDNAGKQPIDVPVVAGGPVGYFSALPLKAAVQQLRRQGIPAAVSYTAGTYNCNHIFTVCVTIWRRTLRGLRAGSCIFRAAMNWRRRIRASRAWRWRRWWKRCALSCR